VKLFTDWFIFVLGALAVGFALLAIFVGYPNYKKAVEACEQRGGSYLTTKSGSYCIDNRAFK
jgi:hypothetical protein